MNERIKELIKSCGIIPEDEHYEVAELIVQECINVAQQQRNPQNLNYKPSERFVEDLRQHFGIR